MRDIWNEMQNWVNGQKPFALARVIDTWGSAPRPVGSAMIVNEQMQIAGSVSGGCIEGAVVEEALAVLRCGRAKGVEYGIEDEKAWSVGLSCGGKVSVLIECHPGVSPRAEDRAVWEVINQTVKGNKPLIWVTDMVSAAAGHLLVSPDGRVQGDIGNDKREAIAAALDAYKHRTSRTVEIAGRRMFIHVIPRRDQLLLIGAGHITQHLVALARQLEFETIVIDPRKVFAQNARFDPLPDQLIGRWPRKVMENWALNEDTYAVLLSHDPKIDDPALHRFLRAPVAYIGVLGSKRTHAKRRQRLKDAGFSDEEIDRIRGPVGIPIGSQTPAEIAVSIVAEVIATKRSR